MITIAWSTNELVHQYNWLSSGHFFDKDTMRFFRSRITGNYRRIDDNTALFITTEKGPTDDSRRKATVRLARLVKYVRESDKRECYKITINTVGDFNRMSLVIAKRFMDSYEVK